MKSSADTRPLLIDLKQAIRSQDGRLLPRRMRLMVLRSQESPDSRTSEAISSSSSTRSAMNSDSCMDANVHEAHIVVKPDCAWRGMEGIALPVHDMHMRPATKRKRRVRAPEPIVYQVTFMRVWRKKRKKTLEEMGALCGKNHGQLSKIEKGKQPYSQPILEIYAKELGCTTADLLTRGPDEAEGFLSLWSQADERTRQTVEAIIKMNAK